MKPIGLNVSGLGRAPHPRSKVGGAALVVLALSISAAGCGGGTPPAKPTTAANLDEVRTYEVLSGKHVAGHVTYSQTPPVGGDHSADVQRCGFYSKSITTERGVHTMEHGAVWITFRPGLSAQDLDTLRRLTLDEHYLLVSRWDHGLPAPIVASAWGRQVMLGSVSDPALKAFIEAYASGPQAPEPHAYC